MRTTLQSAQTLTTTNFELPSLHIIRPEIRETLQTAELHLRQFTEDHTQLPLLLEAQTSLCQVAKVLRLIKFEEAAVLATALADSFKMLAEQADNQANPKELVLLMSEAMMTLERYVEFVLLKETLVPSLILPIINTLRLKLQQPLLSLEDLTQSQYSSLVIANPKQNFESLVALGLTDHSLVEAYRAGLMVVLTAKQPPTSADDLAKLNAMQTACAIVASRSNSLFWQAAAAAVSDLATILPLTLVQKRALIFVEQQFNAYTPIEDGRFADLVHFATKRDGKLSQKLQQKFADNSLTQAQLTSMQQFMFGPDREATQTLNDLIQQEIDVIKSASDDYAREHTINPTDEARQTIITRLHQLSAIFATLNLPSVSQALLQQEAAVKAWQHPTPADFDCLLENLMLAENASLLLALSHTPGAANLPFYNKRVSLHHLENAYLTLISEMRSLIVTIESAINAYNSDEQHDVMHLDNVPELLKTLGGACLFLNFPRSSRMLKRTSDRLAFFIKEGEQSLTSQRLANIADIVMSVDHYLSNLQIHQPAGDQALKIGLQSLQKLLAA